MLKKAMLVALAAGLAAAPALAKDQTLVTVNGVSIKRSEVMDRAYKQFGSAALNAIVDEMLVKKAIKEERIKPDEKEVDSRLKRIQSQFKDKKVFEARLAAIGSSLSALRKQIEDQVMREELVTKAYNLSVTENEEKQYFDNNKDNLGTPESAQLSDILVGSQKEANDFAVAIRAGASFEKIASEVSLDNASKDKGGDMGYISKNMLQPEIAKAVFSAKEGTVIGPIQTAGGFLILRVKGFRSAKPASYEDIHEQLKAALMADKINKAWSGYLQKLRQDAKIVSGLSGKKP